MQDGTGEEERRRERCAGPGRTPCEPERDVNGRAARTGNQRATDQRMLRKAEVAGGARKPSRRRRDREDAREHVQVQRGPVKEMGVEITAEQIGGGAECDRLVGTRLGERQPEPQAPSSQCGAEEDDRREHAAGADARGHGGADPVHGARDYTCTPLACRGLVGTSEGRPRRPQRNV